jgi:hypothetical protein
MPPRNVWTGIPSIPAARVTLLQIGSGATNVVGRGLFGFFGMKPSKTMSGLEETDLYRVE